MSNIVVECFDYFLEYECNKKVTQDSQEEFEMKSYNINFITIYKRKSILFIVLT